MPPSPPIDIFLERLVEARLSLISSSSVAFFLVPLRPAFSMKNLYLSASLRLSRFLFIADSSWVLS